MKRITSNDGELLEKPVRLGKTLFQKGCERAAELGLPSIPGVTRVGLNGVLYMTPVEEARISEGLKGVKLSRASVDRLALLCVTREYLERNQGVIPTTFRRLKGDSRKKHWPCKPYQDPIFLDQLERIFEPEDGLHFGLACPRGYHPILNYSGLIPR